ncbi:MAG TPA: PCRF domain-containing protein, partial [Candidatus Sulfotelmatobacter sp.]|nr:PCRF domain-containing protein [Candidatus Sulfotelmatobacter sp.]
MFIDKLENIEKRYRELEQLVSDPKVIGDRELFTKYSREFSNLKELVNKIREYKRTVKEIDDTESMLDEEGMRELAEVELDELKQKREELAKELEVLLLPK